LGRTRGALRFIRGALRLIRGLLRMRQLVGELFGGLLRRNPQAALLGGLRLRRLGGALGRPSYAPLDGQTPPRGLDRALERLLAELDADHAFGAGQGERCRGHLARGLPGLAVDPGRGRTRHDHGHRQAGGETGRKPGRMTVCRGLGSGNGPIIGHNR